MLISTSKPPVAQSSSSASWNRYWSACNCPLNSEVDTIHAITFDTIIDTHCARDVTTKTDASSGKLCKASAKACRVCFSTPDADDKPIQPILLPAMTVLRPVPSFQQPVKPVSPPLKSAPTPSIPVKRPTLPLSMQSRPALRSAQSVQSPLTPLKPDVNLSKQGFCDRPAEPGIDCPSMSFPQCLGSFSGSR